MARDYSDQPEAVRLGQAQAQKAAREAWLRLDRPGQVGALTRYPTDLAVRLAKSRQQSEGSQDGELFHLNESYGSCKKLVDEVDEMARKTVSQDYKSGIPTLSPVPVPAFNAGILEPAKKKPVPKKEKRVQQPEPAQTAPAVAPVNDMETRMSAVMKGFKEGALKATFDKLVDAMAGPLVEKIVPNIKALGLNVELLEPAVKLAITFAFMLGLAELTAWIAPMASKVVPGQTQEDMALKGQKLAEWMRKYAGEKAGAQVIDAALSVFPMIMASFQDFSTADISAALNEPAPVTTEQQITAT